MAAQVQFALGLGDQRRDPQAWLADVLARLPEIPRSRLQELLPWNWKHSTITKAA